MVCSITQSYGGRAQKPNLVMECSSLFLFSIKIVHFYLQLLCSSDTPKCYLKQAVHQWSCEAGGSLFCIKNLASTVWVSLNLLFNNVIFEIEAKYFETFDILFFSTSFSAQRAGLVLEHYSSPCYLKPQVGEDC